MYVGFAVGLLARLGFAVVGFVWFGWWVGWLMGG